MVNPRLCRSLATGLPYPGGMSLLMQCNAISPVEPDACIVIFVGIDPRIALSDVCIEFPLTGQVNHQA